MAVNTPGHLLVLQVTAAHVQERTPGAESAAQVRAVTGAASEEVAFVAQGDTGDRPVQEAAAHGVHLDVVKLSEAKSGVV